MKVFNVTKNTVIAQKAKMADTFLSRMVGLLNRESISPEEALIITRCQSIHMFFMRFSIDVIFVDKNDVVVGLIERIRPFQLSPIFFRSSYVIEMAEGSISRVKVSLGDKLVLKGEHR